MGESFYRQQQQPAAVREQRENEKEIDDDTRNELTHSLTIPCEIR